VISKDEYARNKLRVSAIPFFIIERNRNEVGGDNRPVSFSGAQPSDLISDQLTNAASDNVRRKKLFVFFNISFNISFNNY
jgi:hypothetical protein